MKEHMSPSRGRRFHFINIVIVVLLLLLFGSVSPTKSGDDDTGSNVTNSTHSAYFPLWCLYFSHLGLLYDNGVNALGTYLGKGMTLRRLNKYKFVWHVMAMPLFAIPVTTIAYQGGGRNSLMDQSTYIWTIRFLVAVSILDGTSWILYCRPQDLRLVDNRHSNHSNGMHLAGTLSYTANAFWQVVLPPLLLVLYEIVVAIQLLASVGRQTQDEGEVASLASTGLTLPVIPMTREPSSIDGTNDITSNTAKILLVCGVLTLLSSGMGPTHPQLQLLGESLHSLLLWAAYYVSINQPGWASREYIYPSKD